MGQRLARRTSGSTRTTSCTTRTRTSSARTTTSATASCASTRTSAGCRSTLAQPLWNFVNACFFEYGIAAYDLELGKNLATKERRQDPDFRARAKVTLKKIRNQMTKDYVIHPLLSGPSFVNTLAANVTANLIRNLWTHSVIMCGHFPEGVETFERRSIVGETRGEWYLRQMLGSANISGSKAMHFMTGNLSASRSSTTSSRTCRATATRRSRRRCRPCSAKYGLTYTTGSLPRQVGSAWKKVIRLSVPNGFLGRRAKASVTDLAPSKPAREHLAA